MYPLINIGQYGPHFFWCGIDEDLVGLLDGSIFIDFHCLIVFALIDDTKVVQRFIISLDKNQEVFFANLFRIRLKVSGVIPSMEAKYCSGTRLNNSR